MHRRVEGLALAFCPPWAGIQPAVPGSRFGGDVDLWQRELTVRGKGGKDQAARSLDRYLRPRTRHAHAWRPQLWLSVNNREPLTAAGIYQMTARRGRQAGVDAFPHRFRHHFSHTLAGPQWP